MTQEDWTKLNEKSHYIALQKQDLANRKLIKKLQLEKNELKKQLLISGVSNRLFDGIEIPTVEAEYFIGYDTYDDDIYCYILARKIGDVTEILLEKRQKINGKKNKDQFEADINKLAEFFNATVNGC